VVELAARPCRRLQKVEGIEMEENGKTNEIDVHGGQKQKMINMHEAL
jgi:hypothetical protein